MIKIENLTKKFGENTVFENLTLSIEDSSFVAVTGASGCGKSTLLNILGAIEPIDSGSVEADGYTLSGRFNKLDYFRNKVGFLFQNFALVENMTVFENLDLVKKKYRSPDMTIDICLEKVGLTDKRNSKIHTLSGGQQQRIALARLMLKRCDIVLADEPTGSLDPQNAQLVFGILKALNREYGKTVIIVTHDMSIAGQCDRVIEISDGCIVG